VEKRNSSRASVRRHLALSNIIMPKGQSNGIALGRMVRMKRLGIKLILMTGCGDLGTDERSLPETFPITRSISSP
jgi:hypothetical protein